MELFDDFMKSFRRWKEEKDDPNLSGHLKNGPSFFRNLSTSDIGLVLSVLLNDKTGLLHFLENLSDKNMESSLAEGFNLLNFIIKEFFHLLNQYIFGIKKVCQSAIITNCLHRIKTAAVHCIASLLLMCPMQEVELDETVQALITQLHSSPDKERNKLLQALGCVARYHPRAMSPADSNKIFERLMNDFDAVLERSRIREDLQTGELKIYLKVLNDLLTNFHPQNSNETSQFYNQIYQCIMDQSSIDLNQRFKYAAREAIELLGSHMSVFYDQIYNDAIRDASSWPNTLLKWSNLPDVKSREAAIKASSSYYKAMGAILKDRNTETDSRKIFQDQMQRFRNDFTIDQIDPTALQLSIRGFGHMVGPCKHYLTEKDVASMFLLISQRTFVMYQHDNKLKSLLENIAYYQVVLSQILVQMSDVSMDQLTTISTLSLILVKRFPDLPIASHPLVVTSLMETIQNIGKTCSRRLRSEFIEQLVYEGIIWSCSHTLYINAEKERELKNLNERPVCYKNYLPLWQNLLCPNEMTCNVGSSAISVEIFEYMIETCVKLMKKLNLDVNTNDLSCKVEAIDLPAAANDADIRILINLVDLFVAVLENLEPVLMESKINWFFCEVIKKSHKNPLISGLYKILRVVLKLYNSSSDHRGQKLMDDTLRLISHYLFDVIERSSSFSGELQASCLTMIFEMPVSVAENMLDRLVFTFKTAFSLGQSNSIVARSALSALEKWTKKMREERTKKFLIEVVPSLESFLQSNETAVDLTLLDERKVVKNIVLTDREKTLQDFQRRILLFFGSLNSEITSKFSTKPSLNSGVLGDDRNLLKYTLLYKDIKPDIYLDTILPRTIDLALYSPDRRTRIIACEVLHAIIIVMLGKKMQFLPSNPDHLLPVFKKICPAVLRLGSDSVRVVQQLFHPLMIQLVHWYSSSLMSESSETDCLIEILFDSLTYESNMALCDFCGVCLAEFVKWSIKQSTDPELTSTIAIIRKITNLAVHPFVQKRIGAAVAFNYLYPILSENHLLIDKFWLEFLFCFIKILEGCKSAHVFKSLKYLQEIVDNEHELLNVPNSQRRKPAEFEGTLLKDAADWLLVQCGSLDMNCRIKSMEFLTVISKHVPALGSVQNFFADYVNRNTIRNLNKIILKDLYPEMQSLSAETMKPLLRTLDCYIWILDENLLSLELLFTDKNANKDMIFNCVNNFIYLTNVKIENDDDLLECTEQYQELCVLKCQIVSKIFDLVKMLFSKMCQETEAEENSSSYIPNFFWNEELYSLMLKCIFEPEVIGFSLQNLEIIESLPSRVSQLLDTMIQKLDNKHLSQLRDSIAKSVEIIHEDCFDLNTIFVNDRSILLKNNLKGLTMLQGLHQFDKLYRKPLGNNHDSAQKVKEIFESLKREQDDKVFAVDLEPSKREYLGNLLELLCQKFDANIVRNLVDIVESKTELTRQDSTIICHGEYFISLFERPIFHHLLKYIGQSMDTLLSNSLRDKFDDVLIIFEDLLIYVKKNRTRCEEFLSALETEFVERFSTFHSLANHAEKQKERLINLYSLLIELSSNPSMICSEQNQLYIWIQQELLSSSDLKYKTRLLNSFLPCIVDDTVTKKRDIKICLNKLRRDYYAINASDLVKGSLKYSNLIASFQTLSRHLSTLKSITFFKCVIDLTLPNVKCFWNDSSVQYLNAYFEKISSNHSLESLQILYHHFVNRDNFKARIPLLNKLLLKCIHFCNAKVIEQFFETNIREIFQTVSQGPFDDGYDFRDLIISKIGCYNLLEIMFAKVPLEKITSADSTIVKNAIESVETGRELFQALTRNCLDVRKLKSDDTASKELMRLLHCAAYNCSIAIVSLKCEDRFHNLLFGENRPKGQLIWENIVDASRRYKFKQDFKEIPKEYKRLINIRKGPELQQAQSYSYMESYDVVSSTLNRDLRCLDPYEPKSRSQSIAENINKEEEMIWLTFEYDDLNNHECMASICGVITHMVSRNILNLANEVEKFPMPKWMKSFRFSLNVKSNYNVKLFMIKVIVNMQGAFKPYAKWFFTPLLIFLNLHFRKYRYMNYVIKDILVMLIDWRTVAIPSQNNQKRWAQKLLGRMIENGDSKQRHIYTDNVEIIDMLIEVWQSCLEIPEGIINISNTSEKFKVRMILTFLANNKQESFIGSRPELLEYLMNSFDNSDSEMFLHISNAFGLILNFLESKNERETKQRIINKIKNSDLVQKYDHKYIKCIHEIHRVYPNIVNYCFKELTSKFFKIDNINKAKYLELFLSALPNLTNEEITSGLKYTKLLDILRSKISACQNVTLKIVKKLLNILDPFAYLQLALLLVPYAKDADIAQREIVMNIFIAVHRKYSDNIEDNIAVSQLRDLSRKILLSGILDTNERVQKKILQFWTQEGNVADKSIKRMLQIFEMYHTDIESNFLPILPYMMLDLVSKDPGFEKEMFAPLAECEFKDYQVGITCCSKDVELAAPRFKRLLSQSLLMRASQSSQSRLTLIENETRLLHPHAVTNKFEESTASVQKIPQPSENIKSNRLLRNAGDLRDNIRDEQIAINLRREEIQREKVDRQRNSIKIYRKYRIGDFPDTEIAHSSLIEPLQVLVKNDQVIARDLTVAIFRSMLKEMSQVQKTEFLEKLAVSLKNILDRTQGSKPLVATVLEIIINSDKIFVSPSVISKVSKSCGLLSLGALLLEEHIISRYRTEDCEPAAKRFKSDNETQAYGTDNDWLQLADMYKSMDDFDTVRGIFGCEKFGKELQKASFAQAASEWNTAKVAYEEAYKINEGLVKDYCQESLFICLAHLSDWKQINHHVETELERNFDSFWHRPMSENWMVSWALEAQIHGLVQDVSSDRFPKALNNWLNTESKLAQLKGLYDEEIAIFHVKRNPEFSESCLMGGLDKIIQEWKHLNPLHYEQKINKYLRLRGLSDVKIYLNGMKNKKHRVPNVECMLNFWNDSIPAIQDNLLLWDKHIAYRLYFFGLLKSQLEVEKSDEPNTSTLETISSAVVKQCLNVAEAAYGQGNSHFMMKYLQYSKPYLNDDNSKLNDESKLAFAKYTYLRYLDSKTQEEIHETYIASWEAWHNLVTDNCPDTKIEIDVRQHIGSLVFELQKLVMKSESISEVLLNHTSLSKYVTPKNDRKSILEQLTEYCLNNLKEFHESANSADKASCYLKISTYCHSMSTDFESGLDLSEEFIHSTLSAMRYGSLEATQYFPCLLHLDYSTNPKLSEEFKCSSSKVETWMFLKWQAQLLSHIGTSISSLITPILLRLAENYPNSFIYAFRMTKEMNKSSLADQTVLKLTEALSENKDLDLFLEAMKYVIQPEHFLKYHLSELRQNPTAGAISAVDNLLTILCPSSENDERILIRGKVYKVIAKYKERVEESLRKEESELRSDTKAIIIDLDESVINRIPGICKPLLEDYSPWLSKFDGGNIEVPGQYAGDKKPMPQYHTKIVKLNSRITILPSLRKPIKITMQGNDGKNHSFLVKFGEDLRTDERIEQLFVLMNRILQGDAVCRQSQLSIDTYLVIPLSGSLGLIQWIENTKSLKEMMNSVSTEEQKTGRQHLRNFHGSWLMGNIKCKGKEAANKFHDLKKMIDWDILRKAFKTLSSSPESFFAIRQNFITSYATICIAQWILGIGDRNLDNTLISYTSGRALGIDFGYSFDTGISCRVPELMPFRLTPQILGLLRPFDENGLLKITMINVLRALKHGKDPLLACMDIFIREPLLDWLAKQREREAGQEGSDVTWYPKKKISIVVKKLNGVKPSKLTLLQLEDHAHCRNPEYLRKYRDVVNGTDSDFELRVRSQLKDENLSIEEQVKCLLDQATDPNILVRSWSGWDAWV